MVIQARGNRQDFEQVEIDKWITGKIVEVEERKDVEKKYKDKETGEMTTRKIDQVRFVFELDGYDFKHRSRWNNLSTNQNSNLYKKYIQGLFGEKYCPDTLLDVEKLIGAYVKTMWDETKMDNGKMFQFVDKIRLQNPLDVDIFDLLIPEPEEPKAPPVAPEEEPEIQVGPEPEEEPVD